MARIIARPNPIKEGECMSDHYDNAGRPRTTTETPAFAKQDFNRLANQVQQLDNSFLNREAIDAVKFRNDIYTDWSKVTSISSSEIHESYHELRSLIIQLIKEEQANVDSDKINQLIETSEELRTFQGFLTQYNKMAVKLNELEQKLEVSHDIILKQSEVINSLKVITDLDKKTKEIDEMYTRTEDLLRPASMNMIEIQRSLAYCNRIANKVEDFTLGQPGNDLTRMIIRIVSEIFSNSLTTGKRGHVGENSMMDDFTNKLAQTIAAISRDVYKYEIQREELSKPTTSKENDDSVSL